MSLLEWFAFYFACLLPEALRDSHDDDESHDDVDLTLTITFDDVEDV